MRPRLIIEMENRQENKKKNSSCLIQNQPPKNKGKIIWGDVDKCLYGYLFNYQMQTEVWQQKSFNEYKPNLKQTEITQKMRSNDPIQLQLYVQYCYYTIMQIEQQIKKSPKLSKPVVERVKSMNKHFVKSQYMPCLIYEHLSETFYSIIEASQDDDLLLINAEIEEAKQTIASYIPNRQYGYYQSFNHLEIDENLADCFLKEKFIARINSLIEECQKAPTNNKKVKKPKFKAKDVNNIVKQKQAQLKKRHEERVRPLLGKLMSKRKGKEQQSKNAKQNEQKYFLLLYGINKYKNLV